MAVGQQVFTSTLDVGAVMAVEARMALREVERSAVHAGLLRDVLMLRRSYGRDGMGLAVRSQVALVLRCSEHRAGELLTAALVLADLPGALEALECGLLGVEHAKVVVDQLLPLPDHLAVGVWERLREQLIDDDEQAVVRPPARLRQLLAGWVIAADPADAVERRKDAASAAEVTTASARTVWSICSLRGCPARTPTPACPGSGRAPPRSGRPTIGRLASADWTRWST